MYNSYLRRYHRTPLTALACPDLVNSRAIARFDFYGRRADGSSAVFGAPLANPPVWCNVGTLALPKALSILCTESARLRNRPENGADAAVAAHTPEAALREYVAGDKKVLAEINELVPKVRCRQRLDVLQGLDRHPQAAAVATVAAAAAAAAATAAAMPS